jgi:predicted enzyme related to lactoylglutathione lyase
MTTGSGRFIWHDLMTTDRDRVIPYYRDLFGWNSQTVDMGSDLGTYQIIHAGDRQIGGFVDLDPTAGVPSHWIGYVSVDDVDGAATAAEGAGGTLRMGATDIPSVGRFAMIADLEGALVCPFRSIEGRGADAPAPADGQFCWDGLLARDPQGAGLFYAEVFGWSPRLEATVVGPCSGVFLAHDQEIAGIISIPEGSPQRSVWLPFVGCSDLDDRTGDVARLGGEVWQLPTALPAGGRTAITADPSGALIGLLEKAEE